MRRDTGLVGRWLRSLSLNLKASLALVRVLKKNRLTFMLPFVGLLLILSVALYVISFSTPLAPFVYSLF